METEPNLPTPEEELRNLTDAVPQALSLFATLSPDNRQKLLDTIATVYGLAQGQRQTSSITTAPTREATGGHFSEDRTISPKEFMLQKQPRTDVERVACLAYYLTHYRDTPFFKTLDISKLNTEAAQMKFSNAAKAVDNAALLGYLVAASKGTKQMSAAGELFVQALPDRDAAKSAMAHARPRRRARKNSSRELAEDADNTQ